MTGGMRINCPAEYPRTNCEGEVNEATAEPCDGEVPIRAVEKERFFSFLRGLRGALFEAILWVIRPERDDDEVGRQADPKKDMIIYICIRELIIILYLILVETRELGSRVQWQTDYHLILSQELSQELSKVQS